MEQPGIDDFGDEDDEERPAAEAAAVAGTNPTGAEGEGTANGHAVDDQRFEAVGESVELAVTQVDYTVERAGREERPVVHVFGRTADDDLEHVRVHEFRPYFYAPTASLAPEDLERDVITDHEDGYESMRGEALTRIYCQTPRDVGDIREDYDHYEADILFPNRFLIDHGVESGIRVPARRAEDGAIDVHHEEVEAVEASADLRVCTFDIEVDDRSGFPEDGEEPIVCLASHDSYRDEYLTWLASPPDGLPEGVADPRGADVDRGAALSLEDYEMLDGGASVDVRVFDSEAAMLAAFLDYVEATDPDVLTGWNFEDFDAPYLLDRLDRLDGRVDADLDSDRLSRLGEVWRSSWGAPTVKGRVVFDLLYAYKRTQFTELESYRLDAVGEQELGVGKERYAGDIGDLWEQEPQRLLEYNLRDVELCVEIDRKQDVIAFWKEVASFVGCKLEDAPTPGDAVDVYVLHAAHDRFALPSKGQFEGEEFEGGAVFDPITGVRENVTVLDLKSLYPMCMVTINASPETKVDADYEGETYRAPNGQRFKKEPDGMMRQMVDDLLTEREEKKELRDQHDPDSEAFSRFDRQQAAVKVIMNCFTPDTDVLTPDGLRSITDLEIGDAVYSLDPETMELEVKPVTETHAYPDYGGDLIDIEADKMDLRVTPNHRMLVRKDETNGVTWDDYRFVEAGDLDRASNYQLPHDWSGPDGERLDEVDLTELLEGGYEIWADNDAHGHTVKGEIGYYPDKVQKGDRDTTGYVFSPEEFETHREYLETACSEFLVHAEPNRKWIPMHYDGDDFLELLAWYVTEGSVYTSEMKEFGENLRGSATTISIAQDDVAVRADGGGASGGQVAGAPGESGADSEATVDRSLASERPDGGQTDHARIGDLLDRMGFDYYHDERGYQFTSKLLGEFLEERCGADSFEKRVPEFVFETSREQKRHFLDVLIAGDGDRQPNSWRYSTASERLRDDVLRLCAHLGITASYAQDSGTWRIYAHEEATNTLRMHRSASRSQAEDGVYCVTVADNHTLLAGRNGKLQFVGQSLYGVSGWDRFRLYDKDNAAAVTATGREVIEFTEAAANELDKEVIYGDTDSVMLELGGDVEKDAAVEQSFEIEEHINSRYDEFAREELNAEFHRFQIEFEKLYRRFFQAGKKKRYAGHVVWSEGKDVDDVDITGFEYQRSDIAPITKEVQLEVIERIVRGEDIEAVKEYVHGVIEEFETGEMALDEVAIPGGIGKRLDNYDTDTAHVRGAKYANLLLGTNFARGSKPKRLYLAGVHADFWKRLEAERPGIADSDLYLGFKRDPDVICFEYADQVPDEFVVDWEKMLDRTLRGPIARVLEALDVSWEEVRSGQTQTGLGSFT